MRQTRYFRVSYDRTEICSPYCESFSSPLSIILRRKLACVIVERRNLSELFRQSFDDNWINLLWYGYLIRMLREYVIEETNLQNLLSILSLMRICIMWHNDFIYICRINLSWNELNEIKISIINPASVLIECQTNIIRDLGRYNMIEFWVNTVYLILWKYRDQSTIN